MCRGLCDGVIVIVLINCNGCWQIHRGANGRRACLVGGVWTRNTKFLHSPPCGTSSSSPYSSSSTMCVGTHTDTQTPRGKVLLWRTLTDWGKLCGGEGEGGAVKKALLFSLGSDWRGRWLVCLSMETKQEEGQREVSCYLYICTQCHWLTPLFPEV